MFISALRTVAAMFSAEFNPPGRKPATHRVFLRHGLLGATVALLWAAPHGCLASISVGPSGQAAYAMPIAVPPGIAGMAPNLSLSYSDGGINGPVGVGWSVQGISSITRCGATRVTDGQARTVIFDGADKLCLDGQRLIQTDENGNPSAATNAKGIAVQPQRDDARGLPADAYREYRTEKDTFARIRAYGNSSGSDPASGPAYFKVWTKSGQVYEYGCSPADGCNSNDADAVNARITRHDLKSTTPEAEGSMVMVWAVRRIVDTFGNYIDFKYSKSKTAWGSGPSGASLGREWNIAEILYTGKLNGDAPRNRVVFNYAPPAGSPQTMRPDPAEAYQLGGKNVSTQRLHSIETYINAPASASQGVLVKRYSLIYEQAPFTGRSRVVAVRECAGPGPTVTKCLPPTKFTYTNAAEPLFVANSAFGSGPVADLLMLDISSGGFGLISGDFNGDGRTDLLRWSNTPAQNMLFFSAGGGQFTLETTKFNLTSDNLFKSDGCLSSMVADFNGDGLSDILRITKSGCTPIANTLFLSLGDGAFQAVPVLQGINLQQTESRSTSQSNVPCREGRSAAVPLINSVPPVTVDRFGPTPATRSAAAPPPVASRPWDGEFCYVINRTIGHRFYVLDVNGDGILDIVNTVLVPYSWNSGSSEEPPTEHQLCLGALGWTGPCTKVFLGTASGNFTPPLSSLPVSSHSLYSPPPKPLRGTNPYWKHPDQADLDGDGLQDILSQATGRWRSLGNGDFASAELQDESQVCGLTVDFNGDGRADCLLPNASPAMQKLTLSYGAMSSGPLAQFNLFGPSDNLYAEDGQQQQTVGVAIEDFDGDGRQDILRWGPSPGSDNGLYLSRGDGSFSGRVGAGLTAVPEPLQAGDGRTSFLLGDFLGTGSVQILHMTDGAGAQGRPAAGSSPSRPVLDDPEGPGQPLARRNQLYYRMAGGPPVDAIESITSPTGLKTSVVARKSLPNSPEPGASSTNPAWYASERVLPISLPPYDPQGQPPPSAVVEIRPPMHVITALTHQTGVGDVTTEYFYKGMKVDRGGRGMLGFRETRQQSRAPNGELITTATEYVQAHPYTGVAAVSKTHLGSLNLSGRLLSRTTNSYCDKTSAGTPTLITAGGTAPTPCANPGKVQRPYVYETLEEGWDLNTLDLALPTVRTTNTYNSAGDPLSINVVTSGTALGLTAPQVFTKLTTNTYKPDDTAGDKWILGRLERASVTNTVPNSLPNLNVAVGNLHDANANARVGTGPPPVPAPLPPAVLNVILQLLLDD